MRWGTAHKLTPSAALRKVGTSALGADFQNEFLPKKPTKTVLTKINRSKPNDQLLI